MMTKELLIAKIKNRYGDMYDFSEIDYADYKTPVTLICKKHNRVIVKSPEAILRKGRGICPDCSYENRNGPTRKKTFEEFISLARKIHGETYDYSKAKYVNMRTKIEIICKNHGSFRQSPCVHVLQKCGCPYCNGGRLWTRDEFIEQAARLHKGKYDYSKFDYVNFKKPSIIICPMHGEFQQDPDHHMMSHGCPKCGGSKSSSNDEVELLEYVRQWFPSARKLRGWDPKNPNWEIDIFIPELRIGFEFNGIYYHNATYKELTYHKAKTDRASKNNILLYHLWDWTDLDLNKSIIASKLNHVVRLYARKLILRRMFIIEANRFYNENHLQRGAGSAPFNYGLCDPATNEPIACMSFRAVPHHPNAIELCRFASKKFTRVIGGMSRLLTAFERGHPGYKEIISFGNRDICPTVQDSSYSKLGFKAFLNCDPILFYYNQKTRTLYNRQHFMKQKLKALWDDFNPEMTEFENCAAHGVYPFFNSGRWKFIKYLQEWNKTMPSE
jgi:hypothetical protein